MADKKPQSETPAPPPVPPRIDPMVNTIKHSGDHGEHLVTRPITFEHQREKKDD